MLEELYKQLSTCFRDHLYISFVFNILISIYWLNSGITLWYIHICLPSILVSSTIMIIHSHPLSPYLKQFQQVSLISSCRYTKYIDHILPPHPTSTLPSIGPILHYHLSHFKSIFIVQKSFAMVFHLLIYCTVIRLYHLSYRLPFLRPLSFTSFRFFLSSPTEM
jgi:hypothetical protein